jgi:hypothetical protein
MGWARATACLGLYAQERRSVYDCTTVWVHQMPEFDEQEALSWHRARTHPFFLPRVHCYREKKLLALIQKQDRLLYICFYMLLNLAEDINIERKMKKKVRATEALAPHLPAPQHPLL